MNNTIYIILLCLTIINTIGVLVTSFAPFTSKDKVQKRALTTISLSWLIRGQKSTLYLSLCSLGLWALTPGLAPEVAKLVVYNLLTTLLVLNGIRSAKKTLSQLCAQESIAVVRLELPESSSLEIWVKKSKEEWPPLYLEIGMGPWSIEAELMSPTLKEKMGETMRGLFPQKVDELCKELKKCLNSAGATHPMDIRGAQTIPELTEFFEKCLLTKPQTQNTNA
jgi:hypothetical protein